LPIFYCMNVSMLLIQPPGCHNPINVMLQHFSMRLMICDWNLPMCVMPE